MPQYFLRITHSYNGSNKLQKAVLDHFERFNNVLTSDPKAVQTQLEGLVTQSCRTYHRCTPQRVGVNKDYKTDAITGIASGGLVTLSVWPVSKELYLNKPTPEPVADTTPAPTSSPATCSS